MKSKAIKQSSKGAWKIPYIIIYKTLKSSLDNFKKLFEATLR